MKSNQQVIRDLIRRVSGQDNFLVVPRLYVDLTGDLNAALLLNQCVYWSDKHTRQSGWFYKTQAEWRAELCLSRYQVRLALKKIVKVDRNLIETQRKKAPTLVKGEIMQVPTLWYRVNMSALQKAIEDLLEKDVTSYSGSEETAHPGSEETAHPIGSEETAHPSYRDRILNRESAPSAPPPSPINSTKDTADSDVIEIAQALAEVTGRDLDLNRARLIKEARVLATDLAGKSTGIAAELRARYGSGGWWYTTDWRGKKGSAPSVANIRETWGQWGATAQVKTTRPKTMRR